MEIRTRILIWLFALVSSVASAEIPVVFLPCEPGVGTLQEATLEEALAQCYEPTGEPFAIITGASADTHDELRQVVSALDTAGVESVGAYLQARDRFDGIQISIENGVYLIDLTEKPRLVSYSITSSELFGRTALLELLQLRVGQEVPPELIEAKAQQILQFYFSNLQFNARVRFNSSQSSSFDYANGLSVQFVVSEGEPTPVRSIEFAGNESVSSEDLLAQSEIEIGFPAVQLGFDVHSADIEKFLDLYQELGLSRTSVGVRYEALDGNDAPIANLSQARGVGVVYEINEQDSFRISSTSITGEVDGEVELDLKEGDPLSAEEIDEEVSRLTETLNQDSDVDLGVNVIVITDTETGGVSLEFEIEELPPKRLISIEFQGLERTSQEFVTNLFGYSAGDMVSRADLRAGTQRLLGTRLFETVDVSVPEETDEEISVVVQIEERLTRRISTGIAYSTIDDLSISLDWGSTNFLGRGYGLNLSLSLAEDRQTLRAGFQDPLHFYPNLSQSLTTSLTRSLPDSRDYERYALDIRGTIRFQESQNLRHSFSASVNSETYANVSPTASLTIQDQEGEVQVDTTLAYDLDYDLSINQLIFQLSGAEDYLSVDSQLNNSLGADFITAWGSDTYLDLNVQSSANFSLPGRIPLKLSLHGAGQYVFDFGEELIDSGHRLTAPLTSLRGFESDGIAPIDADGAIFGGDTSLGFSAQLNASFFSNDFITLNGHTFFDAGTVFLNGADFTTIIDGSPITIFDSSSIRSSAGFGLNLSSRIGTFSLSYALPLSFDEADRLEEVEFSIGTPF